MLRALLVGAWLAAITTCASAQTWTEYRTEEGGYSIEMPSEWKVSRQDIQTKVGAATMVAAALEVGPRAYVTIYGAYPTLREKPVTVSLDGVRNGAVSESKGTLRREENIVVDGFPAREVVIDLPEKLVVDGRTRPYVMICHFVARTMFLSKLSWAVPMVSRMNKTRRDFLTR
jgi:hypothetical protein